MAEGVNQVFLTKLSLNGHKKSFFLNHPFHRSSERSNYHCVTKVIKTFASLCVRQWDVLSQCHKLRKKKQEGNSSFVL